MITGSDPDFADSGLLAPSVIRLVLELKKAESAPFELVVADYSLRNSGEQLMSVPRSGRFQPYRIGLMALGWLQTVTLLPG